MRSPLVGRHRSDAAILVAVECPDDPAVAIKPANIADANTARQEFDETRGPRKEAAPAAIDRYFHERDVNRIDLPDQRDVVVADHVHRGAAEDEETGRIGCLRQSDRRSAASPARHVETKDGTPIQSKWHQFETSIAPHEHQRGVALSGVGKERSGGHDPGGFFQHWHASEPGVHDRRDHASEEESGPDRAETHSIVIRLHVAPPPPRSVAASTCRAQVRTRGGRPE